MNNLIKSMLLLSCMLIHSSCNKIGDLTNSIDKAVAMIDEAVADITAESGAWRNTIESLYDDFPEDLHSVKEDVSALVNEAVGASASGVVCVIDAIPKSLIRALKVLKADLLNTSPPPLIPTVCNTTLSTIDMNLPTHNRRVIILQGYDFDVFSLVSLYLVKNNGTETALLNRVTKQSNYKMTVDIANMDAQLSQYNKVVVKFDGELLSEFSIIQVTPPTPEVYTREFVPNAMESLCPNHIGGDKEFDGHGPDVSMSAQIYIVNQREIWAEVKFHVKETKSNWTEARGEWNRKLWTAPTGEKITNILSDSYSSGSYTDTDHSIDIITLGSGHLVSYFRSVGDTGGDDVGNCNGDSDSNLSVFFNTIRVRTEEI